MAFRFKATDLPAAALGFLAATIIGMVFVVPAEREAERVNIDSDVHRGLVIALDSIETNAAAGDCERVAAQLKLLNARFKAYRESAGPSPANWWEDVVATTRPAGPSAR